MSYFISRQVPVQDSKSKDCVCIMTVFEPISFDNEDEAKKYADLFGILKNSSFDVIDSDSMELYFSNLLNYDVSCCNTQ